MCGVGERDGLERGGSHGGVETDGERGWRG